MGRKLRRGAIIGLVCVLTVSTALLGLQVVRLSRLNQFSKNILLVNNSFLNHDSPEQIPMEAPNPSYAYSAYAQHIRQYADEMAMRSQDVRKMMEESAFFEEPFMLNVPYLSQKGVLPNGCEAVSATMLLQYFGYTISPTDFVDQYLDRQEVKIRWGCRYGPNPSEAYAGDPYSEKGGFGCFAPVIVNALRRAVGDEMKVASVGGQSLWNISNTYLPQGIPVAVWVTNGMKPLSAMYQWQSYDRDETYLYPAAEHCMVLVGFDASQYYLADPYNSNGIVSYPKELVEQRYLDLGMQAVALLPKATDAENT